MPGSTREGRHSKPGTALGGKTTIPDKWREDMNHHRGLKQPRTVAVHPTGNGPPVEKHRSTKHEIVRAQGLLDFERTTCMTPSGFRSVRLHPSTDISNSMSKYQQRPKTAIGLVQRKAETSERTERKETRRTQTSHLGNNSSSTLDQRPSSSRGMIYNVRNSQCSPPEMYRHDELRSAFRESQGLSRQCSSDSTCTDMSRSLSSLGFSDTHERPSRNIVYRYGEPVTPPKFAKNNKFLTHSDLTVGQKQYIWGIARVYSVDHLKQLRQKQYQGTLDYEFSKRMLTKKLKEVHKVKLWKEYLMYQDFIQRYTSGLPRSRYYAQKDVEYKPHRHSCIPWTRKEEEHQILRDRIMLHDAQEKNVHPRDHLKSSYGRRLHNRSRSAPPDSSSDGYFNQDESGHDDLDSGSEDELNFLRSRRTPSDHSDDDPVTDKRNEDEEDISSSPNVREENETDVIDDDSHGDKEAVENESVGADQDSPLNRKEDGVEPYQVLISETNEKLHIREPDDNYV